MGKIDTTISTQPGGRHSRMHDDPLNMHYPRGYVASSAGEAPETDETENLAWKHKRILDPILSIEDSSIAPPTEVDGDIYILDATPGSIAVDTILFQSGNTIRYNLAGATAAAVGDYAIFTLSTTAINDGTFQITAVDGAGLWVEIINAGRANSDDDETPSSPAVMNTSHDEWDGADHHDWVKFNSADDLWYKISPEDGDFVWNKDTSAVWTFTGGNWSQQIAPAVVFGSDYNAQRDTADTVTSSTTLVQHAILNISVAAGTYKLDWQYFWNHDNSLSSRWIEVEIHVDSSNVNTEPHNETPASSNAGQRVPAAGTSEIVLGAGAHTIEVMVAVNNAADVASIFESNLSIFRVL